MEDAPRTVEDDDDDQSESSTSKRRRVGMVAQMALDRERAKAETDKGSKSEKTTAETVDWWPRLESEAAPVDKEAAPLTALSDEETQQVTRELVSQLPALEADPEQAETNSEAAADLADEIFRDEIEQGATPAEAQEKVETIITETASEAETTDVETTEAAPQEFGEDTLELRTPDSMAEETEPDETATPTNSTGGSAAPATPPLASRPGPGFAPGAVPPTPGNTAPAPTTAASRERYEPDYDESNGAGMFLLGGVLGYLLGRRRGRIKTEKKLLPVQKKLEKQVQDLQFELVERQQKVRRLAREKVQAEGAVILERLKEQRPNRVERRPAPEATQLHGARRPERIGKVLMSAETPLLQRPETIVNKLSIEQQVETLNRVELLELASKVQVEGTTLRQIYETHLINERGLRHLVAEHLRGRDIKRLLSQEINERQRDFERDPQLRDKFAPVQANNAGSAALQSLIEKADHLGDDGEQARRLLHVSQAEFETKRQAQKQQRRRLLDIGMVSGIAILLALIIVLFLSRQ